MTTSTKSYADVQHIICFERKRFDVLDGELGELLSEVYDLDLNKIYEMLDITTRPNDDENRLIMNRKQYGRLRNLWNNHNYNVRKDWTYRQIAKFGDIFGRKARTLAGIKYCAR